MREGLRRKLEDAAVKNRNTLTREVINRLERSFTADVARDLEAVANDIIRRVRKVSANT